ncbi:hypothetical protein GYMLUDRAFT_251148 [Collybiopsis luxurians FD-317 M1]|uniref:Uncharacterized protein n=1 Tax=Collybiopsis luxurians FD-317 M1 TaxID=944289 RepID=A0A0D0CCE4_9AGAR|nr:hypothetical protein GYMLUDRAFT_251148 [Collybiopsis luxurians FD-317 M1]
MTCPGSYLGSPTSPHSLPSIRKGQITSLDLQKFTACAEPKHQASNHSLTVGLGEQGDTAATFGKLSIRTCGTSICGGNNCYALHKWMAQDKHVFLPRYIEWLIEAGDHTSLQTLRDNLPAILETDASDSLLPKLIVHIVWCLQDLPKTPARAQTRGSCTPRHQKLPSSDSPYDSDSPTLRMLGKCKARPTTSTTIPYKCPHIFTGSSSSSHNKTTIAHENGRTGFRLSSQFCPWSIDGLEANCDLIYAAATDSN